MKKVVFIILAVVLVLFLGIGIYYLRISGLPIEKVLPESAVFYINISDIEKSREEFESTRLWKNIKNIDVEMLLEKSGLTPGQITRYKKGVSEFSSFKAELLLNEFFGRELALAVYPVEQILVGPEMIQEAVSKIVLVSRIKPKAKFVEFCYKLASKFGQKIQVEYEKYKGYEIATVKLKDNLKLAYTTVNDLLIISLSEKQISICLDVVAKDKPSLYQDKEYIFTKSKLPSSARIVVYNNLEILFSNFRRFLEASFVNQDNIAGQKDEILKSLDKMTGFKTTGFASIPGKISKTKAVSILDVAEMDPIVAKFYSFEPRENTTITFVPKDVMLYQWSNYFDLKQAWDNFQQQLSKTAGQDFNRFSPREIATGIEKRLGMNIERDVIPTLGNEMGGFLSDVNLNSFVPIPEILFFIEIKDKIKAGQIMNGLTANNNFPIQTENYKNVSLKYVLLPFGVSLQPAYCFLDDYLLISSSRKLLKESIDAFDDKTVSLLANEDFQDIDFGLTDTNNSVLFIKTDLLLTKVRGICEWVFNWLSLSSARMEVFQKEAEQRLNTLKKDAQTKEQELKQLKAKIQSLEEEISQLQVQSLDTYPKEQELALLEAETETKKEIMVFSEEKLKIEEQKLKDIIQRSRLSKIDFPLVKVYLNEVIYPVLDGLEENKALGMRSIFNQDVIEVELFSK